MLDADGIREFIETAEGIYADAEDYEFPDDDLRAQFLENVESIIETAEDMLRILPW